MALEKTWTKGGGRDVIVSVVKAVGSTLVGDGSTVALEDGKFYVASAIAESSAFETGVKVGRPFRAVGSTTLSVGDKAVELTNLWEESRIAGMANSKSLNFSRSTFDGTTDFDDYTDKISEDQVEISGSFDGFKLLGIFPEDSAIVDINRQFTNVDVEAADGSIVSIDRSNDKLYLAFIYQKTAPVAGDVVDITFVPCTLSSNGESSSYGSAHTQNVAFEGTSFSDFGAIPSKLTVTF